MPSGTVPIWRHPRSKMGQSRFFAEVFCVEFQFEFLISAGSEVHK
jgi:hypothetical protein